MYSLIGAVSFSVLLLSLVQAQQFSQDIRGSRFIGNGGLNGARTRGQLIQPQPRPFQGQRGPVQQPQQFAQSARPAFVPPQPQLQHGFQPLSQPQQAQFQQFATPKPQKRPEVIDTEIFPGLTGKAPRDEFTQGVAHSVAQFALSTENGGQDEFGKLLHEVESNQPKPPANFVTDPRPSPLVGIPNDDLFAFGESRFIRLSPELREQRKIAEDEEFRLLQGSSARFLDRQQPSTPSPFEFQGPGAAPASQPAPFTALQPTSFSAPLTAAQPAQSGYRALPQQPYQPAPHPVAAPVTPFTATPQPQAAPYPAGGYNVDAYQVEQYGAPGAYAAPPAETTYQGSFSYQNFPGQEVSGFNYGYDVFHG